MVIDATIDIAGAEHVEVLVRDDGKNVWVNVDGVCKLRICRIKNLKINDHRKSKGQGEKLFQSKG
jgi:hypothetical protein